MERTLKISSLGKLEEYPCLEGLINTLNKLPKRNQQQVLGVIHRYLTYFAHLSSLKHKKTKIHIKSLIKVSLIDDVVKQFSDLETHTFVINFLSAKLSKV